MQRLMRAVFVAAAIVLVAPLSTAQTRGSPPPVTSRSGGGVRSGVSVDLGNVIDGLGVERGCNRVQRTLRVIPVIAVFGANDNGDHALAEPVPGAAAGSLRPWRPVAPYLRSSRGGDGDYVMGWIHRANRVLANSGATFRFSETDVAYDRVNDSAINLLGTAAYWDHAQAFFRAKVSGPAIDPRYAGRLVLLFSWGPGRTPRTGGLSDIDSWFVMMPAALYGGTQWEGEDVPGWYMMIHEFGHFMGLDHTFAEPTRSTYESVATGARGYQTNGTFTTPGQNLQFARQSSSPALTVDLAAIAAASSFPGGDGDATSKSRTTALLGAPPFSYTVTGVTDTPLDLGLGWAPAVRNANPCSAQATTVAGQNYSNAVNRTNPMSYTLCDTSGMAFSAGQLAVIETSFTYPHRAYMLRRDRRTIEECEPLESHITER